MVKCQCILQIEYSLTEPPRGSDIELKGRYSTEEKKNYEEKSDMYENYLNTGPKEAQRKKKGETRMSSDEKMKLAWDSEAVRNDEEKSDSFQNW